MKKQRVQVSLPKFEVNPASSMRLNDTLEALGMKTPFSRKADFKKMADPPNPDEQLYIAHVFHKAFVKVDEKGTEAAAASAVSMAARGAAPKVEGEFKADHPFLFFIVDNTSKGIVFMGRVANPAAT
jgi:serine protease inhibitor